jgi:hypothetical protein
LTFYNSPWTFVNSLLDQEPGTERSAG